MERVVILFCLAPGVKEQHAGESVCGENDIETRNQIFQVSV